MERRERRTRMTRTKTYYRRLKLIFFSLRSPKGNVVTAFKSVEGMDGPILTASKVKEGDRS